MIGRRAMMLGLAGAVPAAAGLAALPPARDLSFRVYRNGTQVGSHALTFVRSGDNLDVHIAVDIAVSLGPITLYRYTLRGLEQWHGNQVVRIQAHTDDDGTADFIDATRDQQGLWVNGSAAARYLAPAGALPATHWNQAELTGPWINPQDGKLLHPAVTASDQEQISLLNGSRIEARHFVLSGDASMELWYGPNQGWTALRAPAKDGSTITYALT